MNWYIYLWKDKTCLERWKNAQNNGWPNLRIIFDRMFKDKVELMYKFYHLWSVLSKGQYANFLFTVRIKKTKHYKFCTVHHPTKAYDHFFKSLDNSRFFFKCDILFEIGEIVGKWKPANAHVPPWCWHRSCSGRVPACRPWSAPSPWGWRRGAGSPAGPALLPLPSSTNSS